MFAAVRGCSGIVDGLVSKATAPPLLCIAEQVLRGTWTFHQEQVYRRGQHRLQAFVEGRNERGFLSFSEVVLKGSNRLCNVSAHVVKAFRGGGAASLFMSRLADGWLLATPRHWITPHDRLLSRFVGAQKK